MIRIVFCDLDGTLLPRGGDRLSPETLKEIRRITDKGITFCVASGRPYSQLKKLFGEYYRRIVFICLDGALTMNRDCVLGKTPLPHPERLLGDSDATLFCREKISEIPASLPSTKIIEAINRAGGEILKIARKGSPRDSESARLCYEGDNIYEYVANGADKGTAAKALCDKLRISLDDAAALGDGENDIPMLRAVKTAFRVPDSHPALRDMGFPPKTIEEFLKSF